MEPRSKFGPAVRAFDYLAALCYGVSASVVTWWAVPEAVPGPIAMVLGMILGPTATLPALGLFTGLLGGFEILVLAMPVGMLAGMAGAMLAVAAGEMPRDTTGGVLVAMADVVPAGVGGAALAGAAAGLVVQLFLHALDRARHGEVEL